MVEGQQQSLLFHHSDLQKEDTGSQPVKKIGQGYKIRCLIKNMEYLNTIKFKYNKMYLIFMIDSLYLCEFWGVLSCVDETGTADPVEDRLQISDLISDETGAELTLQNQWQDTFYPNAKS